LAFFAIGAFNVLSGLLFVLVPSPTPPPPAAEHSDASAPGSTERGRQMLMMFVVFYSFFFWYETTEPALAGWVSTYVTLMDGVEPTAAAALPSVYWRTSENVSRHHYDCLPAIFPQIRVYWINADLTELRCCSILHWGAVSVGSSRDVQRPLLRPAPGQHVRCTRRVGLSVRRQPSSSPKRQHVVNLDWVCNLRVVSGAHVASDGVATF